MKLSARIIRCNCFDFSIKSSKLGYKKFLKDQVKILVDLAIKSKLAGVISSAQDLSLVRSISKDLKIFCPGIRGQNDKMHDQKRVMSYC